MINQSEHIQKLRLPRIIDTIESDSLRCEVFHRKYWMANRPLLIKGAIKHWPAIERWQSKNYLIDNLQGTSVPVTTETPIEGAADSGGPDTEHLPFEIFMERVSDASGAALWLHGIALAMSANRSPWAKKGPASAFSRKLSFLSEKDFGCFSFLHRPRSARLYPDWRIFMYRNSITDWHPHVTDSHLMCQILGAKEVRLLPPNEGFRLVQPILEGKTRTSEAPDCVQRKLARANPYEVVVEAGDALHIPIHWYHTVRPILPERFGITLAHAFASPLRANGDRRFLLNRYIYDAASTRQKVVLQLARIVAQMQRGLPLEIA